MKPVADSVLDEPAFARPKSLSEDDENGIGSEPVLRAQPEAAAAKLRRRLWVSHQWETGRRHRRWWVLAGIGLTSGFAAVVCALLKGFVGMGALTTVVGAPAVEEISKVVCLLMVLEKRPWIFSSRGLIVAFCALSGLVFASIENILYFTCYIPTKALTDGVIVWRLSVCTLIHICGASITGWGLATEWRRAAASCGPFAVPCIVPWLVTAMVLHGVYNLAAVFYEAAVAP